MDHDFYSLFSAYWWLIFPLGWGIAALVKAVLRHKRAQQALEVIQSFAQQGKEIPPDLLKLLQQPEQPRRTPREKARGLMLAGFVMLALFVAILTLTIGNWYLAGDRDIGGLLCAVALFASLGVAFLTTSRIIAKDSPPDQP